MEFPCGIDQDGVHSAGEGTQVRRQGRQCVDETLGPLARIGLRRNQILAELDLQIRQSAAQGVLRRGVVDRRLEQIGLIVTDGQPRIAAQRFEHLKRQRVRRPVAQADVPGPRLAVKMRRARVDRQEYRACSALHQRIERGTDCAVIRQEERVDARRALGARQSEVARYGRAIALGRDRRRIPGIPIAVDDEPGIPCDQRRRIQPFCNVLGHEARADVDRDVCRELSVRESERVERPGNRRSRMVADDEVIGARSGQEFERRWIAAPQHGFVGSRSGCIVRIFSPAWRRNWPL